VYLWGVFVAEKIMVASLRRYVSVMQGLEIWSGRFLEIGGGEVHILESALQ
jgi:hypothetical protein